MKKIYIFMFIAILAVIMIAVSMMNFDRTVESWSSFIAGGSIAFLLIKLPSIIAYFESRRGKTANK